MIGGQTKLANPRTLKGPVASMSLRISGKSMDIGDSLRTQAEARIGDAIGKYFDGGFTGHLTVEREGSGFHTDCAIHLDTGVVLRAEGRGQDVHLSFDQAADRIEKRLRRYNRRLKEHRRDKHGEQTAATAYVLQGVDENSEAPVEADPVIIAEEATSLETMTVGHAVMAMDLTDVPLVVFRNAGHGGVNVVYRRSDGNIGWIDPALETKGDARR